MMPQTSQQISPRRAKLVTILSTFILFIFISFITVFSSCKKEQQQVEENGATGSSGGCSCVWLVKNHEGITTSTANAKDWGVSYMPPGYYKVYSPAVMDIVVFGKEFSKVDHTYGHIGYVVDYDVNNDGSITLTVRGANQYQANEFTECGCTNVSDWKLNVSNSESQYVRYYRKNSTNYSCGFSNLPTTTTNNSGGNCPNVENISADNVQCNYVNLNWSTTPNSSSYELYYYDGNNWKFFYSTRNNSAGFTLQANSYYSLGVVNICSQTTSQYITYVQFQTPSCFNAPSIPSDAIINEDLLNLHLNKNGPKPPNVFRK